METSIEQQLVETVRILPEEKQKDVLEYARKISESENATEETEKAPKRAFLRKIEELMSDLPKDAFQGYPTDGSLNHDHYLYGAPKRKS